jgi:hypothetical protein
MATPPATGPITAPYSPQTPAVSVLLMLVVTACTAWLVFVVSLNTAVKDLQDAATRRLDTAAAALTSALVRFDYLPALLETTPAVMELLARPGEPVLRDRANHTLLRINAIAGADMLFVLDERGDALAAADWDQPSTTVGHNYTYRPYLKGALAQGRGRFFGVGATSRTPGYFLSYALRQGSRTLGVATVKINLDAAEHDWAAQPGHTLVSDERGVVILSSRPQWKFSALRPLTAAERAQVLDEKPYSADPPLVPWVQADAQPRSGEQVLVDGQMHLVTALALPTQRWHMQALDPLAPAQSRARNSALVAALATAVTLLLSTAAWQNRRVALDKLAAQAALQAAYDTLEARVAQRTAELSSANASLAAEVQIRVAVEQDLRETQQELVHAAKLAVLGQISAGLAHELNQPLAALRTLSDNALVLMDKQRGPAGRADAPAQDVCPQAGHAAGAHIAARRGRQRASVVGGKAASRRGHVHGGCPARSAGRTRRTFADRAGAGQPAGQRHRRAGQRRAAWCATAPGGPARALRRDARVDRGLRQRPWHRTGHARAAVRALCHQQARGRRAGPGLDDLAAHRACLRGRTQRRRRAGRRQLLCHRLACRAGH